ncbi:MAG: hypothetical protein Q7S36_00195 [Candidatus Liptonbacteria bacterium]|nr:hypothetical protein [Candidatus Liptonbacteria bacterium]
MAPEDGHFRAVEAICDTTAGNLLYESEGVAGVFQVVSGGCAQDPARARDLTSVRRVVAEKRGSFKAIYAICDTPTGNLLYESEGLAGVIQVIRGGCAVPRPPPLSPNDPLPIPAPPTSK